MTTPKRLKIGFVGAGFIGQLAHLDNFVQISDCQLVAIAERRTDLREQVAVKYGIAQTFACHEELLAKSDVDAIVVVTARPHTAAVVADCLKAGKHVLSEKPIAPDSDTASQLVRLAEQHNVYYCVGYMKRFDAGVVLARQKLAQLLQEQSLGKLLHVRASCYMGDSYCNANGYIQSEQPRLNMPDEADIAPEWLLEADKSQFARYVNVYSHVTNLLQLFFQKQPKVDFFNSLDPHAHTCILNYGQFLASLETGEVDKRDWQECIQFIFQKGIMTLELPPALLKNVPAKVLIESKVGQEMRKSELQADWSWAFYNQAKQFVNDILCCNESLIDARYAVQDLQLIEQIWKNKK